ncbi:hypothetical protein G6F46_005019 [Rhizopus delemar]|uniref:Malic enzyme n=2 Tax=Rhizopus TaxID=4842 RepID=A0A9P6Z5J6_9FUNG|nr:hypothetical protein G6F43_004170 [Rhizopus delemar]KAG1543910.1 hypothetical protein G6F51_006384 [Rhizopus arrhizus]KAG1459247.1 hypothetical protein G6F55_004871 [Rhizopus delemar]KAG1525768.1 hypothetical protein G6F52_003034 [Rhizopus delemar]KAG1556383.1 hypothetical protein G6F49_006324 [Rhizopus delemar]
MQPFLTGTAIQHSKRKTLGLTGLLPSGVETFDVQRRRALLQVRSKSTPLEKYIFLAQLRTSNTPLFYKLVMDNLQEFAPIIYTPTVGTACIEYSNIYPFLAAPGVPDGLYINSDRMSELEQTIRNYQPVPDFSPEIAVITDGSRILGLGDLGSNGIGISIGKLQLYVAGAGIDPRRTLPIVLDLGTNNEKLLQDEFYLGLRQHRPADDQFYSIVDKVLQTLHAVYPKLLIQFEDWSSEHAFGLLEKYQDKLLCFNDDIQGTGAVILSGVINAIRRVQKETGLDPREHRILFYGAGSAAIGVGRQIQQYFETELGMTEEEAKKVFWIVDSKGLVTLDRGDRLAQHKTYFARNDNEGQQYKDLMDIINYVKPTALIGLSSTTGAFHRKALERLAELNPLPVIFPLSNPATQAECTFAEAMEATKNRVIFASGTAFPNYTTPTGETHVPGQGNNMYIFPGLGLGAVLAQPKQISSKMIYSASKALADALTTEELDQHWLYPSLTRIREVSREVAVAVIEESIREDLCQDETIKTMSRQSLLDHVSKQMWHPTEDLNASI